MVIQACGWLCDQKSPSFFSFLGPLISLRKTYDYIHLGNLYQSAAEIETKLGLFRKKWAVTRKWDHNVGLRSGTILNFASLLSIIPRNFKKPPRPSEQDSRFRVYRLSVWTSPETNLLFLPILIPFRFLRDRREKWDQKVGSKVGPKSGTNLYFDL